jgi:RimJ/RimL family protein N-acetyltransferase
MFSAPLGDGAELAPLEPWQAAEFAAYIDKHRSHLAPWLPWATTVTDTDGARDFLQRYADRQAADTGRIYAIRLDGELVGGCLFRIFDLASSTCEVGVWISPDAQGRGLITRASQLLIDWAVRDRGMHRVEWRCMPSNLRSRAVAERLGMTLDGTLRQSFPFNGESVDVEVWSLLATD